MESLVDCEAGRRLGCASFCCRLIVRLTPEERASGVAGVGPKMNCVPKDSEGFCIHFDRTTELCRIWDRRPRVCREYDCNHDDLLQVVLREGFRSLTRLVTARPPLVGRWERKRVPSRVPGNEDSLD